jgi:hypothetical protein
MQTSGVNRLLYALLFAVFVRAQTCDNYGLSSGSNCSCPTGFGGSTCAQPGCGGTIFQGSQRPLTTLTGSFANMTAAGCSCETGWTGTGCNVCQTANACQSAFSASGSVSTDPASVVAGQSVQNNNTLVCNTAARVWAAGQMSCQVNVRGVA